MKLKDALNIYIGDKVVNKIMLNNNIVYEKEEPVMLDYFYILPLEDTYIDVANETGLFMTLQNMQYSLDGKKWKKCQSAQDRINVPANTKVFLRNIGSWRGSAVNRSRLFISSILNNVDYNVGGDIETTQNYKEMSDTLNVEYKYLYVFYYTRIKSAANLKLNYKTLSLGCYDGMFAYSSLTEPPVLPATTLADYCYTNMFYNCSRLTTAPELPATNLARSCYQSMFRGCTSLTTAPELPATTLADYCYYCMFDECTSLTTAPELPATALANSCYSYMFGKCTSLTTAPELPATNLANYCYYCMFRGCSSLSYVKTYIEDWTLNNNGSTTRWLDSVAPEGILETNATNVPTDSNDGCPSGWTIQAIKVPERYKGLRLAWDPAPADPQDDPVYMTIESGSASNLELLYAADNGLYEEELNWQTLPIDEQINLRNIEGSKNAIYIKAANNSYLNKSHFVLDEAHNIYASGNIMSLHGGDLNADTVNAEEFYELFKYNSNLCSAPELPATNLATRCYQDIFAYCTKLTIIPELPATTLASECYVGTFSNCTSLVTVPELPAINLAYKCYHCMFYFCTSLDTVPELPVTTLASRCYDGMFSLCSSLTVAPVLPATNLVSGCYNWMFENTKITHIKMYNEGNWNTTYTTYWLSGVNTTGILETNATNVPTDSVNGCPSGWTIQAIKVPERYKGLRLAWDPAPAAPQDDPVYMTIESGSASNLELLYAPDDGLYEEELNWYTLPINEQFDLRNFGGLENAIYIKAADNSYLNKSHFVLDEAHNIYASGNIMSLHGGDLNADTVNAEEFYGLFQYNSNLCSAPELPATNLASSCYQSMFQGCTSLTTAPELPATTLADYCYSYMFHECVSLTTAPELPATTLKDGCYFYMFCWCNRLTTAPVLPATIMATNCYMATFCACRKINKIICYSPDLSSDYIEDMLSGTSSTGDFYNLGGATNYTIDDYNIPAGWTIHTTLEN